MIYFGLLFKEGSYYMQVFSTIIKPLALGVLAYIISAVGFWFVLSFVLLPWMERVVWVLPAASVIAPLFISGYVAGRFTLSKRRILRIAFGIIAGIIGFALFYYLTHVRSSVWLDALLFFGAAIVAASGAFTSTRIKHVF